MYESRKQEPETNVFPTVPSSLSELAQLSNLSGPYPHKHNYKPGHECKL